MSEQHFYELMLIGKQGSLFVEIEKALNTRVGDLGMPIGVIKLLDESNALTRDRKLPAIAVFCGYEGADNLDHPILAELLDDSITIVTVVSSLDLVSHELPEALRHINALECRTSGAVDRIISIVLEHFRLLRAERKLFISYKRDDSTPIANTLYDELDRRGFDVFLDTRSVPPAKDFQNELWHRLADADVIVLLDTPGFRSSRWTTEELARANATNVQVLHVLWPGQNDDGASSLSFFHPLEEYDFSGPQLGRNSALSDAALIAICDGVERLRARAIAARYRYLVDGFCDAARDLGFLPNVHPDRWISLERNKSTLCVIPAVGVPTSDRLHKTFTQLMTHSPSEMWLIYDNRGLLDTWLEHLDWLDKHLPIRTVRMASAYDTLAGA
ncbi:toll/interleukin-1 receptor domain-containing protein [Agrobacterium sp. Azo12]|uniref:toll/interleukin-1 receptor domain-containing protein n=1 Tax=Agrobacterium sp. Azo12 TaxID=3031129 RepID=UPI0023D8B1E0|nr:toll/interleukin-1 receptor domain-containing protein [Agrobacterium sp. Azo12]MDO5895544.1 toll/interleukin-1 receptor domain-containing protein [Agrobacterium sp. Azo12]